MTDCFDDQRDDIDLLLSEMQREQLLHAAFAQCMRGRIHCRIQRSSRSKARLILWTIDCSQKLMIDLWTSFDQLARHRLRCIPAEQLLHTLTEAIPDAQIHTSDGSHATGVEAEPSQPDGASEKIPALRQLPPDIDLCLLIQHLATKHKKFTTPAVKERIARAGARLASCSPDQTHLQVSHELRSALRDVANQLTRATHIPPKFIALSEEYLLQRLACVPVNRGLAVPERRQRQGLLTGLRKSVLKHRPTVAVIGSDGAGKSSVVSALESQQPHATSSVAKKLYRRSLTYLMISGLMKRLRGTDRGMFDDRTAPLITLRAAAALWIRMCLLSDPWSKFRPSVADREIPISGHELSHTAILDRSIASFLITHRKSDMPVLATGSTWIESLIPPVTSVLLLLPHSVLTGRKQEMSAPGHDTYQRMLFEQALRQQPADLILLASLPSAQAAARAIIELLRNDRPPIAAAPREISSRKAVA